MVKTEYRNSKKTGKLKILINDVYDEDGGRRKRRKRSRRRKRRRNKNKDHEVSKHEATDDGDEEEHRG